MGCPLDWLFDAIKWVWNAIKTVVEGIIDAIGKIVTELFQWLKNLGEWLVETIVDVAEFIKAFVTFDLKEIWNEFLELLYDTVDLLNFTTTAILNILDAATFGVLKKVWNVVSKIISVVLIVVAMVTGNVAAAIVMITMMILAVTGLVTNPLILMLIAVVEYLTLNATGIADAIDRLVSSVAGKLSEEYLVQRTLYELGMASRWDVLKALAGEWIDVIGGILDMTYEEVLALFEGIASGVEGILGPVLDALKSVMGWVVDKVQPVWDTVKQGAMLAYDYIGLNVSAVLNKVSSLWNVSFNTISDAIGGISDWLYYKGEWVYNFVSNNVVGAWYNVKNAASWAYNNLKNVIFPVWDNVKNSAINAWSWLETNLISIWGEIKKSVDKVWTWAEGITQAIWNTVKNNAIDAWNYISNTVQPFVSWVKETVWPHIETITTKLTEVSDWINEQGKAVYAWYAETIRPYLTQIQDLIHKAAVITSMVAAIRDGSVVRALLTGIGIVGGPIEQFCNDILKYYDGSLSSILKGVGYGIGAVRKMITDAYAITSRIASDIAQVGINVGWDVLTEVGQHVSDIVKITLGKARITLGEIDLTVRDWIAYLKEPATRALAMIRQAQADFTKYSPEYRAAYLRQLSTATGRPFYTVLQPKVVYEGVR